MHEVVHLSFGPQADALHCEFYNQQQKYFVYNKSELDSSHVDPQVRFVYGREYTPRAVFWDFRNGFGKQKQYRHELEEEDLAGQVDKISLPSQESEQWADHAEFPIHQSSMHRIPDWDWLPNHPFGIQRGAPEGQHEEFEHEEMGTEQFSAACHQQGGNAEDYLDTTLRPQLERCDLLEGVNLVTDLGGWGGFASRYLATMRDEFVTKQPIFTWALSRPLSKIYPRHVPLKLQLSRVETMAQLSEFSSLVLPLENVVDGDFRANARAHLPAFESLCLLSSMRRNRIGMERIVQDLTVELPQANILQVDNDIIAEFSEVKRISTRNTVVVNRPDPQHPEDCQSSDQKHSSKPALLDVHRDGNRDNQETVYDCPQVATSKKLQTRYEVNDRPLALRTLVRRHASHDLRELVGDLTDNNVWRWESDSDSDF